MGSFWFHEGALFFVGFHLFMAFMVGVRNQFCLIFSSCHMYFLLVSVPSLPSKLFVRIYSHCHCPSLLFKWTFCLGNISLPSSCFCAQIIIISRPTIELISIFWKSRRTKKDRIQSNLGLKDWESQTPSELLFSFSLCDLQLDVQSLILVTTSWRQPICSLSTVTSPVETHRDAQRG